VSRYLEHTLTRDTVRRDRQFDHAMKLVEDLVKGPLLQRLGPELRRTAEQGPAEDYWVLLEFANDRLEPSTLWFPTVGGKAATGEALHDTAWVTDALLVAEEGDPVAGVLAGRDIPVVRASAGEAVVHLAMEAANVKVCQKAEEAFCIAQPSEPDDVALALCRALCAQGREIGLRCEEAIVGAVRGAGSRGLWVRVHRAGEPQRAAAAWTSPFSDGPPILCLNSGDARVGQALKLARARPQLAAALLLRLVALGSRPLSAAADWRLTELALRP
jgi:hypothetical protein